MNSELTLIPRSQNATTVHHFKVGAYGGQDKHVDFTQVHLTVLWEQINLAMGRTVFLFFSFKFIYSEREIRRGAEKAGEKEEEP